MAKQARPRMPVHVLSNMIYEDKECQGKPIIYGWAGFTPITGGECISFPNSDHVTALIFDRQVYTDNHGFHSIIRRMKFQTKWSKVKRGCKEKGCDYNGDMK